MKKRITAVVLSFIMAFFVLPGNVFAAQNIEDIIILYENDVHCAVEGYSKLSAMKKEYEKEYAHVGVVSGGDYIQGNSIGAISQGEYIVDIMNLVGYDAVAIGNHEFDFRLTRLDELVALMDTKPVSCNFQKIGEENTYFEPYSIVSYGDVDVAFIGITTPESISMSSPAQFKDADGEFIYTFNPDTLYDIVQENIDSAKADGAEYVVAISHIGYAEDEIYGDMEDIETLIENTDGFDVVIDAHSHSVIESKTLKDKGGNDVLLSSTGTKFEYIGKLTISGGEFETELIKTEEYVNTDSVVDAYIQKIYEEYAVLGNRKVAYSEVDLVTKDADGNRLVRIAETNIGDFCADAIQYATDADVVYINGGGLRADILSGDVTFNSLLNVLPFNNNIVLAKVSGQDIKDMLEMAVMSWPAEDGSFPHVAGVTFSVNTAIESSIILNEQEEFEGVAGRYRVYDVKVFNDESGKYEPINLENTYTIASYNYFLLEGGGGMKMLSDAEILQNEGVLDVEVVERYVTEDLNGVIGEEYREMTPNITFTDGELKTSGSRRPLVVVIHRLFQQHR